MTGLVNRHTNLALQLKASSIFAEVNGFAARVLSTLTYFNSCEYDVEGTFVFPQEERTTVVEFEATIEERHVFMEVQDFVSFQCDKNVYALEEREDDLFSISIGGIPPLCCVFVQVTLITELGTDRSTGGSLFVLPSVFTPRLVSEEENEDAKTADLYGSQMLIADLPRRTFEPYSFELQLEVAAPCLLAGCSSRTHAIQVDADSGAMNASRIHISIAEPHTYDRELEIVLHLSHPYDPYILIEEGKKEPVPTSQALKTRDSESGDLTRKPAVMINYTPRLSGSNSEAEFIFLVDRSGSMSGDHIYHVKETLILSLKSLPDNCLFNVVGFGSYYRSLFQESERFCEASLEKACAYIHKMRADLGGTNLLLPLKFIFEKPTKHGTPRIVFLMTDGGVSNTIEVVDFVRRNVHTTRFYTFGLGPEACPNLVQGVAGVTRGKAYFISDDERMPVKVMEALEHAMQPAITDIEVSWHLPEGYDVIQTPTRVPLVFNKERLVLYGILSRPAGGDKGSPRTPVKRKMDWSMRSFSNSSVKVFWFEDECEFLPVEQLIETDESQTLSESTFEDPRSVLGTDSPTPFLNRDGVFIDSACADHSTDHEPDAPGAHVLSSGTIASVWGGVGSASEQSLPDHSPSGSKFHERDSGVEFGMEESDKSPDEKDGDIFDPFKGLTRHQSSTHGKQDLALNDSPLTEEQESVDASCVQVYKNSSYLEQLGVPSDFGAVNIKGFSGSNEVEQVIPFPVNRSGGSSKRPTIHQLVARSLIRELQASRDSSKVLEEVRQISKLSKVHCRHTSLVTLDQYCYDDEFLSALQFSSNNNSLTIGSQNTERKSEYISGLGRRLPSPEGSDQETLPETAEGSDNRSLGPLVEPVDLYRLERTGTPENLGDDVFSKSGTDSPASSAPRSPNRLPSLSTRYVVGERQALSKSSTKPLFSGRFSPLLTHTLKEHFGFVRLANLQSAQGSWALTSPFADIFDLSLRSLLDASPLADGSVCVSSEFEELLASDTCDDGQQLWATALALAWLQREWFENHVEWELLAGKADHWLSVHPYPRGFVYNDLKTAAFQALLLLGNDKTVAETPANMVKA